MRGMRADKSARTTAATVIAAVALVCIGAYAWSLFTRPAAVPLESIIIDETEQGLSVATKTAILRAQEALKNKPDDVKAIFALAGAYLQAVRENADTAYYARVESLLQNAERTDAGNPEIAFLRGNIAAGRHDFATALKHARPLVRNYPQIPRYFGLLADAQIELGMYEEAAVTLQTMADLRPDYGVYTRVAYLREIHGDLNGAMEMMREALDANSGIAENIAWTLTELGRLTLERNATEADGYYDGALAAYPDFAPALAGKAKVALKNKDTAAAKIHLERALDILPLPEYASLLGDMYAAEGNTQKAAVYFRLVEVGFDRIAQSGTNVDLERAKFLLEHDRNLALAHELALRVYASRPTIYAADVLALSYYKKGNNEEAKAFRKKALLTGTLDPVIRKHAGIIGE